jgi:hypothetical protein
MVYFHTKNPNSGKFWSALDWKMLIYFTSISNILHTFGIFYDHLGSTFCVHLVHFFWFWYHVPRKIWQPCFKCGPHRKWPVLKKLCSPTGKNPTLAGLFSYWNVILHKRTSLRIRSEIAGRFLGRGGAGADKLGFIKSKITMLIKASNNSIGMYEFRIPYILFVITRGRCYDHNFLRFFPIFGEKNGVFLKY